ncbi:MAG: hypothetical protein JWN44_1968 [Myxococcales bacterium]|nr:hypothetical protein [Myxococcales bacterium]
MSRSYRTLHVVAVVVCSSATALGDVQGQWSLEAASTDPKIVWIGLKNTSSEPQFVCARRASIEVIEGGRSVGPLVVTGERQCGPSWTRHRVLPKERLWWVSDTKGEARLSAGAVAHASFDVIDLSPLGVERRKAHIDANVPIAQMNLLGHGTWSGTIVRNEKSAWIGVRNESSIPQIVAAMIVHRARESRPPILCPRPAASMTHLVSPGEWYFELLPTDIGPVTPSDDVIHLLAGRVDGTCEARPTIVRFTDSK